MRIKLKEPLVFIAKPELLEFNLELVNNIYVIKEGNFKQNIKMSEYNQIIATQVKPEAKESKEVKEVKKTKEQLIAEKKAAEKAKKAVEKEKVIPEPLSDDEEF